MTKFCTIFLSAFVAAHYSSGARKPKDSEKVKPAVKPTYQTGPPPAADITTTAAPVSQTVPQPAVDVTTTAAPVSVPYQTGPPPAADVTTTAAPISTPTNETIPTPAVPNLPDPAVDVTTAAPISVPTSDEYLPPDATTAAPVFGTNEVFTGSAEGKTASFVAIILSVLAL